jgi:hypothetical protein
MPPAPFRGAAGWERSLGHRRRGCCSGPRGCRPCVRHSSTGPPSHTPRTSRSATPGTARAGRPSGCSHAWVARPPRSGGRTTGGSWTGSGSTYLRRSVCSRRVPHRSCSPSRPLKRTWWRSGSGGIASKRSASGPCRTPRSLRGSTDRQRRDDAGRRHMPIHGFQSRDDPVEGGRGGGAPLIGGLLRRATVVPGVGRGVAALPHGSDPQPVALQSWLRRRLAQPPVPDERAARVLRRGARRRSSSRSRWRSAGRGCPRGWGPR